MTYKRIKACQVVGMGLLGVICFYWIAQKTNLNYVESTLMKIGLFVGMPILYQLVEGKKIEHFMIKKDRWIEDIRVGVAVGLGILAVVLIAYSLCCPYIDVNNLTREMTSDAEVPKILYPLSGLYATLGNSFVEEYFFRGFIFWGLYRCGLKKMAYLFSAGLFAVYHVAIFQTWFSLSIVLLSLTGLFLGGLIFNHINRKNENILNSWIVHIFADLSIMIIAVRLFY